MAHSTMGSLIEWADCLIESHILDEFAEMNLDGQGAHPAMRAATERRHLPALEP